MWAMIEKFRIRRESCTGGILHGSDPRASAVRHASQRHAGC
jgi:hypothetical protein